MNRIIVAALIATAAFLVVMVILAVIPPILIILILITGFIVIWIGANIDNVLVGWIGVILLSCTLTLVVLGDIAATPQGVFALIFVVVAGATTIYAAHEASEAWIHRADAG